MKVTRIIVPTGSGPFETVIISLPESAFADLAPWAALGFTTSAVDTTADLN